MFKRVSAFSRFVIRLCKNIYPTAALFKDLIEWKSRIIRKNRIWIGMITAPAKEAQQAADLLVISGIKGILNLSGARVIVPSGVETKDIDLGSRPEATLN